MTTIPELKKDRDPFFDSLKFVLIALVVFGHTLQKNLNDGSNDHLLFSLFMSIYAFHMPLFVLITGYFSRGITWSKYKGSVLALIVTYFIFQTLLCIPEWINEGFDPLKYFITPMHTMWYLQALIVWRLLFCFVPQNKYMFPLLMILSTAASLIIGYKQFIYIAEVVRVVTFLPYFVLGYYFKPEWFAKIRSWDKLYTFILLIAFILGIYMFLPLITSVGFFGSVSYKYIYPEMPLQGLIDRVISFPITIFSACLVINLCPTRFSNWGKFTLPIYLVHSLFIYIVYIPYMNAYKLSPNIFTHFVVFVTLTAVCLWLSKWQTVQCFVDPVNYFKKKKK